MAYKVQKRKREQDKDSEALIRGVLYTSKRLKERFSYARKRSEKLLTSSDPRERHYFQNYEPTSDFNSSELVVCTSAIWPSNAVVGMSNVSMPNPVATFHWHSSSDRSVLMANRLVLS